jgi:hypothetical protein
MRQFPDAAEATLSEFIVRSFVNPSVGNFGISASVEIREGIHESQNASDAVFEKSSRRRRKGSRREVNRVEE